MSLFEKQTAIVTGASAGIGLATAKTLHRLGASLVLNARRRERLDEVAGELGAVAVAGDITDAAVRGRIVEACEERVDILVNNAGYGEPGPVETVSEEDFRRQFEVNLFAAAAMIRAVLPLMRAQRSGRIVNISSVAGRLGYPLFGWYCASKHALEGLSDALRLEVSPWGIHVALVEPGPVETEFFDVSKSKAASHIEDGDSPYAPFFTHVDTIEKDFMKQAVPAQAVADAIVRACSDSSPRARYVVSFMAKSSLFAMRVVPRGLFDKIVSKQFYVPTTTSASRR